MIRNENGEETIEMNRYRNGWYRFYKLCIANANKNNAIDNYSSSIFTYTMLARVHTCAVTGLDGVISEVEVDYTVEVPRVRYEKLSDDRAGDKSALIRQRVEVARQCQRERFKARGFSADITSNADMHLAETLQYRPRLAFLELIFPGIP